MNDAANTTSSFGDKLKSGLATAAKVGAAALTASSTAIGALVKSSTEEYAQYEQLVGGVDTLFKEHSDEVMENAHNAYKTAGLSANEYMDTVNGFAASLRQSLGDEYFQYIGDYADQAVTDMADNANKMGTNMADIQHAYQGFAKQNYTMLDNLKLGYGGTKDEMSRLLRDAEKLEGYYEGSLDIENFADVVDAIHIIQEEMGITGTTAKEASTTIEGSVASMKASWSNLKVGIADDSQDIDGLIDNFVESVSTAGENIIPRIEKILAGIGTLVTKLAPIIAQELPKLIETILPPLVEAGAQLLGGITQGLVAALPALAESAKVLAGVLIESLLDAIQMLLSQGAGGIVAVFAPLTIAVGKGISFLSKFGGAFSTVSGLVKGGCTTIPGLLSKVGSAVKGLFAILAANPIAIVIAAVAALVAGLITLWNTNEDFRNAVKGIWDAITGFFQAAGEKIKAAWESIGEFFSGLWEGIKGIFSTVGEFFGGVFSAAAEAVKTAWGAIKEFFSGLWEAIKSIFSTVGEFFKGVFSKAAELIKSAWAGLKDFFSKLWDDIKNVFSAVADFFRDVFSKALEKVKAVWNTLKNFFAGLWEAIKSIFATVADVLGGFFKAAKEAIQSAWSGVVDFFSGVWEGIKNIFSVVADVLSGFFSAAWEAIQFAWNGVVDFFVGVWEGIKNVFSVVADVLGGFFSAAWEVIQSIWSGVVAFFSGIWEGIKAVFATVVEVLGGIFSAAWEAIKTVWNAAKEFFSGVVNGIKSVFEGIGEFLGGLFKSAWEAVKEAWSGAKEFFADLWKAIKEKAQDAAEGIKAKLKEAWTVIKAVWNEAKEFFGALWSGIKEKGAETAENVKSAFSKAWEAIKSAWNDAASFFGGVWESIKGAFGNVWSAFKKIGSDMLTGLWNGISDKIGWLKSKVSGIVDIIKSWFTGKKGFDEHSPSKWANQVFRYVMEGGEQGLEAGMPMLMRSVSDVMDSVKSGMAFDMDIGKSLNFKTASVGLTTNKNALGTPMAGYNGMGNTTVNIYSPVAVDAVQAAREWKKTAQRMAMGYV